MKIGELKDSNRRYRYYRLRKAVLAGVPWGYNEVIKIVEVSRCGSRAQLIVMNRQVRRSMDEKGFRWECCFVAPMVSEDGLCRLKGLMRLEKGMGNGRLLGLLELAWGKKVKVEVEVYPFDCGIDLKHYIREHMLQAVVDGDFGGRHLAMSRGWKLGSGAVSGGNWFRGG